MLIRLNALSQDSISKAIARIDKIQLQIIEKNGKLVKKLAKTGIEEAGAHLNTFKGDSEPPTLESTTPHVKVDSSGNMYADITIRGEDVAFVEFGAGIRYNTEAGTSPHPKGVELGYTIGSYGHGHGAERQWTYVDENGIEVVSYGTEAAMPLAHAKMRVEQTYADIAASTFKSR